MSRWNKRIGIVFIAAVLLAVLAGMVKVRKRNEAPIIWLDSSEDFVYTGQNDVSELCRGVKASDKEDGDITDAVMVEQIVLAQGGKEAKITYAVKDSRNRVAKIERLVSCQLPNQEEPPKGEDGEVLEPEAHLTPEPTPEPTSEPLPPGSPEIKLKTNTVHIRVGENFYFMDYIESLTDDTDAYIYQNIQVDGQYDTRTAGTYTLLFYAVDKDNNKSNVEKLTLIVE